VLLEVPGHSGLAGRTADAVARGLDRVQTSSRQPLSGLRPLGLRMEVCYDFFLVGSALFFCCFVVGPQISLFCYFSIALLFSLSYSWTQISNNHKIKCFIIFVGSGVWLKMILVVYSPSFSFGSLLFVDPEFKFSGSGILIWLRI